MTSTEKKVTNQRVQRIALTEIKSGNYQRPTRDRQVNGITDNFDEAKLGMPVVSERNGVFYLLDGNHRVSALRKLNFTHATFIVLEGLTYEQEAEFFRSQNENTRSLTKFNLFRAGLEAKDPLCVNIDKIVRSHDYAISGSARNANAIMAIYALETVATVYGFDTLDKTLGLIRDTWDGVKNAVNREFLVGVAEFVHRFGTRDFADRMRLKKISTIWQDYAASTASYSRSSADPAMRRAFCRVLVEHYNKGIASKSKKRLTMEENHNESANQ